jgi:hypothetical protein
MCSGCGEIDTKRFSANDGGDIRDKMDFPETGDRFSNYTCDCDGPDSCVVLWTQYQYQAAPHGEHVEQEENQ